MTTGEAAGLPRIRAWLELARAPAIFTAVSNIVAATLIATGSLALSDSFVLAVLASVSMYVAGMILNDCFDIDEDARHRPTRPLPSGRISRRAAWAAGVGLLAAGPLLALAVSVQAFVVAVMLAIAIVTYDGIVRRTAVAPVTMGLCRALNVTFGLVAAGAPPGDGLIALPVFFYVTGLTWLGTVETDARSRLPLAGCIACLWLAVVSLAGLVASGLLNDWLALLPALVLAAMATRQLVDLSNDFEPAAIQRTMRLLILGIVPVDAVLVLASGSWWGIVPVIALMLPARWLAGRMAIS